MDGKVSDMYFRVVNSEKNHTILENKSAIFLFNCFFLLLLWN